MKNKAQEFIQRKKENHLLSLGLHGKLIENKVSEEYLNINSKYVISTGKFTTPIYEAIEISDEEYKLICMYCPPAHLEDKEKIDNIETLTKKVSSINSWVTFWSVMSIVLAILSIFFGATMYSQLMTF